ncbi:SprT family protein [Bacillus sp. 165]|uniref:SprT family protein n=1 Tax=Bacillus sp. 165 TaxID=1529117 RepID=UPI001ADCA7E3|nr:SprT family protein [Bacillus sp. 165]MBO9131374.1 SprT family protein [Bacillus sp. 165]
MKEGELQELVEKVSWKYFHKPFLHKAVFNKRLRTTGGRYLLNTHNIELNYSYYKEFGADELIQVIKHELCHYHLHIEGKGYQHRDRDFRKLLQQIDAPRFCKALPNTASTVKQVKCIYQCLGCGIKFPRKRRVNTERYACGRCGGKIEEVKN